MAENPLEENKKENNQIKIKDYWTAVLSGVIGAVIGSSYQYIFGALRWTMLIFFGFVLLTIIILHISFVNKKIGARRLASWISGGVILGLLLAPTIAGLIPSTNKIIQAIYFPTSSPTITQSLSSITPSENPADGVVLTENCIPVDWNYYSSNSSVIFEQDNCLDVSAWGISGQENGLSFIPTPPENIVTRGVYVRIPKQNLPLRFKITIGNLSRRDILSPSPYFFIGNFRRLPSGGINGDYAVFYTMDNNQLILAHTKNPTSSVSDEYSLVFATESLINNPKELTINFSDSTYSIQFGSDSKSLESLDNLPYIKDEKNNYFINLIFGMRVPPGSEIKAYISGLDLSNIGEP